MGRPTNAQKVVRKNFRKSCDCFNRQPDAGGVVPPAIGPRNKSWWHTESLATVMRYYNYFMHETLLKYHNDDVPDWCVVVPQHDTFVSNIAPNANEGASTFFNVVRWWLDGIINRAIFRRDQPETDYALIVNIGIVFLENMDMREVGCYSLSPPDWDEMTATWNNQPTWGALLDSQLIEAPGFFTFDTRGVSNVGLKFVDESPAPPFGKITITGATSEHVDPVKRAHFQL